MAVKEDRPVRLASFLSIGVIGLLAAGSPASAQYGGGYGEGYGGGYRERGYGGGGYGARGSFLRSCTQVEQRGPYLRAMCGTVYGDYAPAQIDVRRCGGRGISNQNGRLSC